MRKLTLTILTFCFGLAAIAPAFANCPRCIEARKNKKKTKVNMFIMKII